MMVSVDSTALMNLADELLHSFRRTTRCRESPITHGPLDPQSEQRHSNHGDKDANARLDTIEDASMMK